jgi:hypothetical protein
MMEQDVNRSYSTVNSSDKALRQHYKSKYIPIVRIRVDRREERTHDELLP